MKMTINGYEYEIYIGGYEDDGHWEEIGGKEEWVVTRDKAIDEFIERIGDKRGILYTNVPFEDEKFKKHFYCGDVPVYWVNGYEEGFDGGEKVEVEEIRAELLKYTDCLKGRMEMAFWTEDDKVVYYTSTDGRFVLNGVEGLIGDIFGWPC